MLKVIPLDFGIATVKVLKSFTGKGFPIGNGISGSSENSD